MENTVIILTHSQFTLKKKLIKVNDKIPWAFISDNLSNKQKLKIFEFINKKEVKLVFISPENFFNEKFFKKLKINLLVFEDFHRKNYFSNENLTSFNKEIDSFLLLTPLLSKKTMENCLKFVVDRKSENFVVFPKEIILRELIRPENNSMLIYNFRQIYWVKIERNLNEILVNFLRNLPKNMY